MCGGAPSAPRRGVRRSVPISVAGRRLGRSGRSVRQCPRGCDARQTDNDCLVGGPAASLPAHGRASLRPRSILPLRQRVGSFGMLAKHIGSVARTRGSAQFVGRCPKLPRMTVPTGLDEPLPRAAGGRRILVNTLYSLTADVGSKLASLALVIVMARRLGAAGYGVFVYASSFSAIIFTLAHFGQDQVLTREVAADRTRAQGYFSDTMA